MNSEFQARYSDCFSRPEVAISWAGLICNQIGKHLCPLAKGRKNGGMMVWWVAIKESQYCGILKKELQYAQAASLLKDACPDYFPKVESLAQSFKIINNADHSQKQIELIDAHGPKIRRFLTEILPKDRPQLSSNSTILEVVEEIAEQLLEKGYNRQRSFIYHGMQFAKGMNVVNPPVAIVTYPDDEFIRLGQPSSVVSFEFVDGELTENKTHLFHSRYQPFGNRHHPILVARSVASERVVEMLSNWDFGLCIVNPDGTWHRQLSRSVNDFEAIIAARQALLSGNSDQRLIVYNSSGFTTLPELLRRYGCCVRKDCLLKRPILSRDGIKKTSYDYLLEVRCNMNGHCVTDKNLTDLAALLNVRYSFGYLPDYQLELCDFDANEITINLSLTDSTGRGRFTLGHGLGHMALQKPYVNNNLVYTCGQSYTTLYPGTFPSDDISWLEWQADQFSHYFLMPDAIIQNVFSLCVDPRTRRMGKLYVDDNPWNLSPFKLAMHDMSVRSRMSVSALTYRLKEMGLLDDQRTGIQNINL